MPMLVPASAAMRAQRRAVDALGEEARAGGVHDARLDVAARAAPSVELLSEAQRGEHDQRGQDDRQRRPTSPREIAGAARP